MLLEMFPPALVRRPDAVPLKELQLEAPVSEQVGEKEEQDQEAFRLAAFWTKKPGKATSREKCAQSFGQHYNSFSARGGVYKACECVTLASVLPTGKVDSRALAH